MKKEADLETATVGEGEQKFKRLGWKKLTICLIVEAIALGALSIPSAFATLGMVAGVILSVGIGLIAIYTSYVVGQVKIRNPEVEHYADAVGLIWGRFGYELTGAMFALYLTLCVGSHVRPPPPITRIQSMLTSSPDSDRHNRLDPHC